jgi:hypothetical protein
MPRRDHRCALVAAAVVAAGCLGASACGGNRRFQYLDGPVTLRRDGAYHVVVNGSSQRVAYDYTRIIGSGQDYDAYASGRKQDAAKPDVPLAIADYLHRRGARVQLGPEGSVPPAGEVLVVRYRELWGWDLGDIIKALTIAVSPRGGGEPVAVTFEEMTIFNSRPTAKNLVPQMMDHLFARGRLPGATAAAPPTTRP